MGNKRRKFSQGCGAGFYFIFVILIVSQKQTWVTLFVSFLCFFFYLDFALRGLFTEMLQPLDTV